LIPKGRTGTVFFITDDGYLISNDHVVKGAAKVRLLTGAGLLDASVLKVAAANNLALLSAGGRFAPLAHCRQSDGETGRHGGHGGFPGPRVAGLTEGA
jgi:serine protease Do